MKNSIDTIWDRNSDLPNVCCGLKRKWPTALSEDVGKGNILEFEIF